MTGLSAEDQQIVQNAAQAAYDHTVVYQLQAAETGLAKIMEAKPEMKVTVLSDNQRSCFKEAAAEVEA